uniref:Uncharacterized protein n=1 Tax=Opuntia streptacantha TaxID=393608 RepID=A0A7C8ZFE1_OPUST
MNLPTNVRTSGIGHLGLTLSEILHMGAIKIAPLKPLGFLKWINKQIAPPIDSPYRKQGKDWNSGDSSIELKKDMQSSTTSSTFGTNALRPSDWPCPGRSRAKQANPF